VVLHNSVKRVAISHLIIAVSSKANLTGAKHSIVV
jgi:hypothetical protein